MPRSRRRTVSQDVGSFHIISRVAGGELLFNDGDKEFFLKLLERLASGFFVEIHAFCIMSNHFHILATGLEKEARDASKEELFVRYRNIFGEDADPPAGIYDAGYQLIPDADAGEERLRRRLGSISRFVQELKQTFTRWYNNRYERTGYLWGARFNGVIVSKGEAQLAGSAYIDLNPVRKPGAGALLCYFMALNQTPYPPSPVSQVCTRWLLSDLGVRRECSPFIFNTP